MPIDADIENMSLQDLSGYQQELMADITSGAMTMDDAKIIIKRIDKRLKLRSKSFATRASFRNAGRPDHRRYTRSGRLASC
jgi:hypothetical protein